MASIRERTGRRGTTYAVLYREDGSQRSDTFTTRTLARRHAERIERLGPSAARRILDAEAGHDPEAMPTVAEQVTHHIDALSGVQDASLAGYRTIARQLTGTALGALPLDTATREDVAAWIRDQERAGSSAKTIKNRQALLSAALTRAVDDGLVPRNVAARARITRTERREMTFLTPGEFQVLLARATPHYRPLLMWLYGTGMRLGEATALRVSDVHLEFIPATVTVTRAWKRGGLRWPDGAAEDRRGTPHARDPGARGGGRPTATGPRPGRAAVHQHRRSAGAAGQPARPVAGVGRGLDDQRAHR